MRKQSSLHAMKELWIHILSAFIALGCLSLASQAYASDEDVLNFGMGVDATTLDPHNWKTAPDLVAINLIYEGLVAFDADLSVTPVLATSWERLDDVTWKFNLRKNVTFQDGTPFNAQAAKVNFDRMKDAPRAKGIFGIIDSVETPDDYTLLIRTKHPFAPFLNNMCHPVGSMISPAALEKYGKDIGRHPVGTGKFVFEKWLPNQRIVLKRNDNYWGPKPSLTTVNLIPIPEEGTRTMAFESGEIDIVSAPAPHRVAKFKKDDDVTVTVTPAARTVWLGYNLKDKVLSNPKVREAIALAINRKELVNDVAEGLALDATGWIPSIIQKSDQNFNYPYDPAKAKKLLAEAGYPNGLDIKLWTPEGRYLKDRQIAEALQAQLSDVGIRAHLSVMEWAAYVAALFRSEQQLFIWGWAFQVGDPDSMLRENFYSTSSYGCTGYQNQEFDKMLDKAVSTFDPESRKKQYDAIQQLLFKDVVGAPIYFSENIFAMHNNVNGFIPHPLELIVLDKTKVKED